MAEQESQLDKLPDIRDFNGLIEALKQDLPPDSTLPSALSDQELCESCHRARLASSGITLQETQFSGRLIDTAYEAWRKIVSRWYESYGVTREKGILRVLSERQLKPRIGLLLVIRAESCELLIKEALEKRKKGWRGIKRQLGGVKDKEKGDLVQTLEHIQKFSDFLGEKGLGKQGTDAAALDRLREEAEMGISLIERIYAQKLEEAKGQLPIAYLGRTKHAVVKQSVVALVVYLQSQRGAGSWWWDDLRKVFGGGCLDLKRGTVKGWIQFYRKSAE